MNKIFLEIRVWRTENFGTPIELNFKKKLKSWKKKELMSLRSLPLISFQCPLSDFKKVSKIWLVHLCLTSERLAQVKIDNKSILALTIEFYRYDWCVSTNDWVLSHKWLPMPNYTRRWVLNILELHASCISFLPSLFRASWWTSIDDLTNNKTRGNSGYA